MKRKFTKLAAAFALLAALCVPLGMWGQTRETVNDVITAASLAATSTTYTDFTGVTFSSDAVYAGNSAKTSSGGIQLRAKNSSGIVSTASGGTIHSVSVTVESGSNTLDIYGNNTAYTGAGQLYSSTTQGTKIGSISATGTVDLGDYADDFQYIGIRSNNGAIYLTNITITWTTSGGGTQTQTYTVTYVPNGGTGEMTDPDSPYEENEPVTLLANAFGAPEGKMWDSWLVEDADENELTVTNNTFTMPASNVTVTAQWVVDPNAPQYEWVLTDWADLTDDDIFVIVGNNTKAMANSTSGNNNPSAVAVTIQNGKITNVTDNMKWNRVAVTGGYKLLPNGSTTTWLNNPSSTGLRIDDATSNNVFTYVTYSNNNYLKVGDRYACIYNNGDWRAYATSSVSSNATNTTFFRRQVVSTDPAINASNVNITYNATSGTINYTIDNPDPDATIQVEVATGATITNLVFGTPGAESVSFTCDANSSTTSTRTAVVTLNYVKNNVVLAYKNVTITQAVAPVIYSTIPGLFAAATTTQTPVTVSFGGWVVTGVNGGQSFVTDGTNGFIMYQSGHGFVVGNTLTGTVSCNLILFNGSAEITGLTSTTEGLTVEANGVVTPVTTTIDALGGVNTGSVVTLNNLTYNGSTLTDGTNTIDFHTSLYNGTTLVNGKTYNITGVFVLNNSTKRILPRSADDIVEVVSTTPVINADDPETLAYNATSGAIAYTIDNSVAGTTLNATTDAEWVSNIEVGASSITFDVTENEGNTDRTATFTLTYTDAQDKTVTVTQGHYVAPFAPTLYEKITSTLDDFSGQYIIVGFNDNDAYAMAEQKANNRNAFIISEDGTYATVISDAVHELTIAKQGDYYTIYDGREGENNNKGYLYAAGGNGNNPKNYLKTETDLDENNNGLWAIGIDNEGNTSIVSQGNASRTIMRFNYNSGSPLFSCYGSGQQPVFLYKKSNEAPVNYTLTINGYTDDNSKAGYYLIASPVKVNPATTGMTTGDFDLYYFDQVGDSEGKEWINYEAGAFNLVPGKGYLYAKKATSQDPYSFTLTGVPYDGDGEIELTNTTGADFAGWNLVGNPFGEEAEISMDYYELNPTDTELIAGTDYVIDAMQGVFVKYSSNNTTVIFEPTSDVVTPSHSDDANVVLNVTRNRGNVIDRAIVRFGEGQQLPKFQLNPNNTKIYVTEGNQDFAVVRSAAEAEMPVSFKASENGTYTLAVETENVEMNYLHLIDNMTGMDVDLLQTPSYTFEAKTNDYTSRFRLVFKASSTSSEADETFAYYNGSNWTVSNLGEATLQVVDVTGRMVSNETISGNATISLNQTPGVYMLRLVNGNDVKVQKVVVR